MASADPAAKPEQQQQQLRKYRGNCHCGGLVFEIQAPEITIGLACNCSMCTKKGYLGIFPPSGTVDVVKDDGLMRDYTFGAGNLVHKFCSRCGTGLFVVAKEDAREEWGPRYPACETGYPDTPDRALWGANIRALQDVDHWKVPVFMANYVATGDKHAPPAFEGPEPAGEVPDAHDYFGGCHCGAVGVAVKLRGELNKTYGGRMLDCNCSMCRRAACIWVYPMRDEVVITGEDKLTKYSFGRGFSHKTFCTTCGVHVSNETRTLTADEMATLPTADVKAAAGWYAARRPINLRVLHSFDIASVEPRQFDGWAQMEPPYVNP